MEQTTLQYAVKTKEAVFQGKVIKLTNRTPIFTPEQHEKQRLHIERQLYEIANKHAKSA